MKNKLLTKWKNLLTKWKNLLSKWSFAKQMAFAQQLPFARQIAICPANGIDQMALTKWISKLLKSLIKRDDWTPLICFDIRPNGRGRGVFAVHLQRNMHCAPFVNPPAPPN